jgi:predicted metal-dependent peptidase
MLVPNFKKAKERLEKVMLDFYLNDPILLNVLCMVNKQPDLKQDTIGIDVRGSVPVLKYNPNFINIVNDEVLELLVTYEAFKILLRHVTTRLKEPISIASLASSITINQLMNYQVKELLKDFNDMIPSPNQFGLEKNKFYEHYFRNLLDNYNNTMEKIQQIWNSLSDQQKEQLYQQSQETSQNSSNDSEEQHSNREYKQFDNNHSALKEYFNPNGTSNQGWGKNDLFEADVSNLIESKKDSYREWGKYSGSAMAEIIAANQPKISYKEIVKFFNRSIMCQETLSSRMKVNRRHNENWIFPGQKRKYKTKVIFAIDSSGSMTNEDLAEGFAIINHFILKKAAEIILIEFDTKIKKIETNLKKAKQTFKVHGRGGTDFQAIMDIANKENCDGLIIYTDGCANAPTKPNCKVLWLMNTKKYNPPVDWGYVAHLDRFEDAHAW